MNNNEFVAQIRERLQTALQPQQLEITDESHLHHGHPGAQHGAGHFALKIASEHFSHRPLLDCHRLIYQILADLIPHKIHALRITVVRLG